MYKFAAKRVSYEDYSSGRVLYSSAGATNFPVRALEEIFLQVVDLLQSRGNVGPYVIYDPFCGIAYSMTVLGLLYDRKIKTILASDSNSSLLERASKNLSLLTQDGIAKRIEEIRSYIQQFDKDSHREALKSALNLQEKVNTFAREIETRVFAFNILGNAGFPNDLPQADIILGDLPYGRLTEWDIAAHTASPTQGFLNAVRAIVKTNSVIAVSADKKQNIEHQGYKKIRNLKMGRRKVLILEAEGSEKERLLF